MEYDTFYFLPAGEPKENESAQKYSTIYSNVGINNIAIVTNDRIKKRESFILLPEVINHKGNIILLIPSILDVFNALSYDGVEYAMRLYFKYAEQKKENFQIVVLGTEEESAFWNHCKYSAFLKCPHVKYAINNVFEIKEQLQFIQMQREDIWIMNWNECRESIKAINITPPASYKTHHSITNEWSIYRWSKYIGVDNVNIQREIDDFLYFNYLKALNTESVITATQGKFVNQKGKILLIDDEEGKGWAAFFSPFCNQSKFQAIGDGFKKMSRDEVIYITEQVVTSYNPDVIILDLRLLDGDFDETDPLKLTGHAVFEKIKTINKGIQVIIFSASNKIWNYLPLSYDGIVLKESPEQSIRYYYTKECIEKLGAIIDRGIIRGCWLKEVYARISTINDLILKSSLFQNTKNEVVSNFEIAFELLSKNNYDAIPKYLAYSYLQLYIVIEKYLQEDSVCKEVNNEMVILDRHIVARWEKDGNLTYSKYAIKWDGSKYIVGFDEKTNNDKKFVWKETNFKMSALLLLGYGVKNVGKNAWQQINHVRNNKAGHPERGNITLKEYENLLDFMIFIFNEANRQCAPMDYSLPRISSAKVTFVGKDCQAQLEDGSSNLPLQFEKVKPKLNIGDKIDVEIIIKNGKPSFLRYIIR